MLYVGIVVFFVIPGLVAAEILRCAWLEHRRDRIPILLYHRLISRARIEAGEIPDVEPIYASFDDVFDGQMRYLRDAGYAALGLDEFAEIRAGRRALPDRPVVITFDDGYESNYTLGFPALSRYGHKATIFVAPEPDAHTRAIVEGIDAFLTLEQMRELDGSGVAIESHTLTHCVLAEQTDEDARRELVESNRVLGEIVGRKIRHLAIPRSGYSRRIRRIVREVGYVTVSCNAKGSSNGWSNLQALPRIVIERDMSVDDFARALTPRTGLMLRLLGNVKRLPAMLFGSSAATRFRTWLYASPVKTLFQTRQLRRLIGAGTLLYAAGIVLFVVYVWRHVVAG